MDRDGDQDLVTSDQFDDTVSVLLGDGLGGFASRVSHPVCDQPIDVVAGDLDGDGNQDLAAVNAGDNSISILLGDGQGSFAPRIDYLCGVTPVRADAGDLDADGRQDMIVANRDSSTITVMLNKSPAATMAIDGHATSTTDREVTLSVQALGVSEFRLRDQGGAWGEWTPYAGPGVLLTPEAVSVPLLSSWKRRPLRLFRDYSATQVRWHSKLADGSARSQAVYWVPSWAASSVGA